MCCVCGCGGRRGGPSSSSLLFLLLSGVLFFTWFCQFCDCVTPSRGDLWENPKAWANRMLDEQFHGGHLTVRTSFASAERDKHDEEPGFERSVVWLASKICLIIIGLSKRTPC